MRAYLKEFYERFRFVQLVPIRPSYFAAPKYFLVHATNSAHGAAFLNDIESWRVALAGALHRDNDLDASRLTVQTQALLDRIGLLLGTSGAERRPAGHGAHAGAGQEHSALLGEPLHHERGTGSGGGTPPSDCAEGEAGRLKGRVEGRAYGLSS